MGCDIHIYAEVSRDSGQTWVADSSTEMSTYRNYYLFGKLAGVRSCRDPIYRTRGLPHDCSDIVRSSFDRTNDHSPGWLTLAEFKKVLKASGYKGWTKVQPDAFSTMADYPNIVAYCDRKLRDIKGEHILLGDKHKVLLRLVFWFDS